jgi:MATE family multidrug resistance protein
MGMREGGAALATNITYIANMIICDIWCYSSKDIRKSMVKPSWDACNDMCLYIKVAIPGACMLCFEWWVFELLAIFSGLMSVEALAAEVVIVNIVTFIFMVPLGTSYAASALTGVFLGEMKI